MYLGSDFFFKLCNSWHSRWRTTHPPQELLREILRSPELNSRFKIKKKKKIVSTMRRVMERREVSSSSSSKSRNCCSGVEKSIYHPKEKWFVIELLCATMAQWNLHNSQNCVNYKKKLYHQYDHRSCTSVMIRLLKVYQLFQPMGWMCLLLTNGFWRLANSCLEVLLMFQLFCFDFFLFFFYSDRMISLWGIGFKSFSEKLLFVLHQETRLFNS